MSQQRSFSRSLGRARLNLDDLDELLQMLRMRCATVSVTAGPRAVDQTEELRRVRPRDRRAIGITTTGPDVLIALGRSRSTAATMSDSPAGRHVVEQVERLVRKRATAWAAAPVLPVIMSLVVAGVLLNRSTDSWLFVTLWLALTAVPVVHYLRVPSVIVEPRRR